MASEVISSDLADRFVSYRSGSGRWARMAEFFRLWRELRRERFDAAVYMVTSERTKSSVVRDRAFFRSARIKELFGFHAIPTERLYPAAPDGSPARSDHEAAFKLQRLSLDEIDTSREIDLREPIISPSEADLEETRHWLAERRRNPSLPLVSIGPGCKQEVNVWDPANFVSLARRLMKEFPCEIMIVGGKAEFDEAERMVTELGGGINAAGAFSVRRSAALLSQVSFHIGLDTGTTHLAAAVGTRCFAIFGGRNNPGLWYPLGEGHTVIHHPVPCSPCRVSECAVPGHPCMSGITVEAVWKNLDEFIRTATADAREIKVVTV